MSDAEPALSLPPPPPRSDSERRDWLRLIRSYRVGPATFYRLLDEHGSAAAALAALPNVARAAGVENYHPASVDQAMAELRAGRQAGAQLLAIGEPDYPAALAALGDPPPLLWALGDLGLLRRPGIALVGTRQATSLGVRMARRLAEDLGRAGNVVVSGLARGIDAAAHAGSLGTGTIAVMAGGVDVVYPPENAGLAAEIAAKGLRLSDQPIGLEPQARHFARRNRLIAGLSLGVVVVEAPARSGALITASDALEAGREVMAVPGHPMDSRVTGCNQLIRDGAVLVRSAEDVLEALSARGFLPSEPAPPAPAPRGEASPQTASVTRLPIARRQEHRSNPAPEAQPRLPISCPPVGRAPHLIEVERAAPLGRDEKSWTERILRSLSVSPQSEDQLGRALGIAAAVLGRELTSLELEGRIERHPGGLLSRAP